MINLNVKAHVIVSGRVQGVYFRGNTRREAQKQGVNGWVRNLPDGRVEAVFAGEKENVNKLIEIVKKGPSHANVTDLKIEWLEYKGEFKDFQIRY
ncbi:MAG TPA: acylphosphatase [Methanobacterium sp.]|nr:acylphosphatase [Methanobacterium sp.]